MQDKEMRRPLGPEEKWAQLKKFCQELNSHLDQQTLQVAQSRGSLESTAILVSERVGVAKILARIDQLERNEDLNSQVRSAQQARPKEMY